MKQVKMLLVLAILLIPFHATAGTLYVCGKNVDTIKAGDIGWMIGGAVASMAVHELGHIGYMEATNTDYDMGGFPEITYTAQSDSHARRVSNAGFIAQTAVGLILVAIPKTRELPMTFGFTAFTTLHALTYDGPDYETADKHGGDSGTMRGVYAGINALATASLIRYEF